MCDIIYLYSASKHIHSRTSPWRVTRERELDSNLRTHTHSYSVLPLFAHLLYLRLHTWIEIPNISLCFAVTQLVPCALFFLFWRSQNVVAVHFQRHQTNRNAIYIIGFYKRQLIKGGKQQQSQHRKFTESLFVYPLLSFYRLFYFHQPHTRKKAEYKQLSDGKSAIEFFSLLGFFS